MIFILIAIYGLSVLAFLLGSHFVLIKYLGGVYLVGLGVVLWVSKPTAEGVKQSSAMSSSFLTGLLITLGDQKAILFYLGFLPAFVNLSAVSPIDTGIILAIATCAVGAPKLLYAFLGERAGMIFRKSKVARAINVFAGSVMVGVGVYLLARA